MAPVVCLADSGQLITLTTCKRRRRRRRRIELIRLGELNWRPLKRRQSHWQSRLTLASADVSLTLSFNPSGAVKGGRRGARGPADERSTSDVKVRPARSSPGRAQCDCRWRRDCRAHQQASFGQSINLIVLLGGPNLLAAPSGIRLFSFGGRHSLH